MQKYILVILALSNNLVNGRFAIFHIYYDGNNQPLHFNCSGAMSMDNINKIEILASPDAGYEVCACSLSFTNDNENETSILFRALDKAWNPTQTRNLEGSQALNFTLSEHDLILQGITIPNINSSYVIEITTDNRLLNLACGPNNENSDERTSSIDQTTVSIILTSPIGEVSTTESDRKGDSGGDSHGKTWIDIIKSYKFIIAGAGGGVILLIIAIIIIVVCVKRSKNDKAVSENPNIRLDEKQPDDVIVYADINQASLAPRDPEAVANEIKESNNPAESDDVALTYADLAFAPVQSKEPANETALYAETNDIPRYVEAGFGEDNANNDELKGDEITTEEIQPYMETPFERPIDLHNRNVNLENKKEEYPEENESGTGQTMPEYAQVIKKSQRKG